LPTTPNDEPLVPKTPVPELLSPVIPRPEPPLTPAKTSLLLVLFVIRVSAVAVEMSSAT
jgi:hypothetical protein